MTPNASYRDNTMLSAYKECPRKYYLRHVLGWRGKGLALPLAFGLSWHSAMDTVWNYAKRIEDQGELAKLAMANFGKTWEEQGLPFDLDLEQIVSMSPRTPSIAHEMLVQYIKKRWTVLQNCELISAEQPFAVPLPRTDNIWYIGRLDKVAVIQGEKVVVEHKTTTDYKKDGGFRSTYVEGWYSDSQVKGYQFGGGLFFPGLEQVWVDAALVHKVVHDAFRFIPVAHQQPLLEEWIRDTRNWALRIQSEEGNYQEVQGLVKDDESIFPKNEGSCMGKFGACPYLNICRTTPDPSKLEEPPEGYIEEFWRPFELLGVDKLITKGD